MATRAESLESLAAPFVACVCGTQGGAHAALVADGLARAYPAVPVFLVPSHETRTEFVARGLRTALSPLGAGDELRTADPAQVSALLDAHTVEARLRALINQAPCVAFIKGTPAAPRCGFTSQLLALLREHRVLFSTYDILGDEDARQGLKTLSDWPTYPQVYLRGELVGGLDIVRDLLSSGDYLSMGFPVEQ